MLKNCLISGFADEISPSLSEQAALLNELGIAHVEFRSADGKNVADYTVEEARSARALLAERGISLSAVGSPIGKVKLDEPFEPHFDRFRHVAELAAAFGTPNIRIFSFYPPEDAAPDDCVDEAIERLGRMADWAKANGLVLLHENEKGICGDNAARSRRIFEALYSDSFKCTFDFANFVQSGQDTLEAFTQLRPYIGYVHIKDALLGSGAVVPAGEGDGNVRRILSLLDADGYTGYLSLEPHLKGYAAQHMGDSPLTPGEWGFRTACAALRGILGE